MSLGNRSVAGFLRLERQGFNSEGDIRLFWPLGSKEMHEKIIFDQKRGNASPMRPFHKSANTDNIENLFARKDNPKQIIILFAHIYFWM